MKLVVITAQPGQQFFPARDCITVKGVAEAGGHPDADLFIDLDFEPETVRMDALARLQPAPVIVNAVVPTIAQLERPFIRLNGWPGFGQSKIHELVVPDAAVAATLQPMYENMGLSFRLAPDLPGMITARILAAIINEAWYTWQAGVSSKEDIDIAMKLGTHYPMGPFEWGDRIGLARILRLLEAMCAADARHAPADSLKRAATELKYD